MEIDLSGKELAVLKVALRQEIEMAYACPDPFEDTLKDLGDGEAVSILEGILKKVKARKRAGKKTEGR